MDDSFSELKKLKHHIISRVGKTKTNSHSNMLQCKWDHQRQNGNFKNKQRGKMDYLQWETT